jgi:hypothetical protein
LAFILAAALLVLTVGCGSAQVITEPAPVDARQQIINDHNADAGQQLEALELQQEDDIGNTLAPLEAAEADALRDVEETLKEKYAEEKEKAEVTLAGQELQDTLDKLASDYEDELATEAQQVRDDYAGRKEQVEVDLAPGHQRELNDLEVKLKSDLEDKLRTYDREQERLAAEQAAAIAAQEQPEPVAQAQPEEAPAPAPKFETAPPGGPAPGTKAPVEPVVIYRPPPLRESADKPLRREGNAPLGQRRYYVNKYFGAGETLQKIQPSAELGKLEHHEIMITFWMEGTARKAVPKFMLNGMIVRSWQELEKGLEGFRAMLIAESHILYPKVIFDQRGDVPRSVTDDVLSVCFKVGIRHISMGSREPLMEQ